MAKKSITRHNEKCDHLDYLKTSASDTECTGVVYTGPLNDVELENIKDVYAFEPEPAKKREVWEKFYTHKKLSMLQFFYRKLFLFGAFLQSLTPLSG